MHINTINRNKYMQVFFLSYDFIETKLSSLYHIYMYTRFNTEKHKQSVRNEEAKIKRRRKHKAVGYLSIEENA